MKSRAVPDQSAAARLVDVKSAAAYCGMSYWTMRDLVNSGQIEAVRFPRPWAADGERLRRTLIDLRDLDQLIAQLKERNTATWIS